MNLLSTIQRTLRGDRRAQRRLYEEHVGYVLTVLRRFDVPERDRPDVLQTVFVQLFAQLDRYNPDQGKFTTWLRTLTVRRAIDHLRKQQASFVELTAEVSQSQRTVDHERNDLRQYNAEQIIALVKKLSPGYRAVFNLYAIDGYSHEEIGQLLDISPGTSRSQYARARYQLQEMITQKKIRDVKAI